MTLNPKSDDYRRMFLVVDGCWCGASGCRADGLRKGLGFRGLGFKGAVASLLHHLPWWLGGIA